MLIVLASSLRLNFSAMPEINDWLPHFSQPKFVKQSADLVSGLKKYSPHELASILHVSDSQAVRDAGYYEEWASKTTPDNARQALIAFDGDAYRKLNGITLNKKEVDYLQRHLYILSGLYGMLRPMDLIQPHRLEMGTKLPELNNQYLFDFWRETVIDALNQEIKKSQVKVVVNLASKEYARVIDIKRLHADMVTPIFQEWRNNKGVTTPMNAKRARGMMVRYAATQSITEPEDLKSFDEEGYVFDSAVSNDKTWVFRR